jgi:hypothetical protein
MTTTEKSAVFVGSAAWTLLEDELQLKKQKK